MLWTSLVAGAHAGDWAADWTPGPFQGAAGHAGVAISRDGSVLAASGNYRTVSSGDEWRQDIAWSRDGGRTWSWTGLGTRTPGRARLLRFAMDGEGSVLAALVASSQEPGLSLWVTSDAGASWSSTDLPYEMEPDFPESEAPTALAIARDTRRIFVLVGATLHQSDDLGAHWVRTRLPVLPEQPPLPDTPQGYRLLSISADGRTIAAAAHSPAVCILSQDAGTTWRRLAWQDLRPAPLLIRGLALGADGRHLVITSRHDHWETAHLDVLISEDAGAHWRDTRVPGRGVNLLSPVALSDDGLRILIGGDPSTGSGLGGPAPDPLVYSSDGGTTWITADISMSWVAMSADGRIQIGGLDGWSWPKSEIWINGLDYAPVISGTTREGDLELSSHGTVTFSVSATGGRLAYQWRRDGEDLVDGPSRSGTRSAVLVLSPASATDIGRYSVLVSNRVGSVEADAGVLRPDLSLPEINEHRQSGSTAFIEGASLEFHVVATGGQLDYQWRRNGADLVDTDGLHGSRSPTLGVRSARADQLGEYSVVVRNPLGSVQKIVGSIEFTAPRLLRARQIGGPAVRLGDEVRLEASAAGGGVTIRWHRDDVPITEVTPIPGAITNTLVLPAVQAVHTGLYHAVRSNHLGILQTPTFHVYLSTWAHLHSFHERSGRSVSVSPDGSRLLVLSSSAIRHSSDAGRTWSVVNPPGPECVDGFLLDQPGHWILGEESPIDLARTTDSGTGWDTFSGGTWGWEDRLAGAAVSAEGKVLLLSLSYVTRLGGGGFSLPVNKARFPFSRDAGQTWQEIPDSGGAWASGSRTAGPVAMSHDGQTLAAVEVGFESRLHLSRDGGLSWAVETLPSRSGGLAVSPAGDRLYLVVQGRLQIRTFPDGSWESLGPEGLWSSPSPCSSDNGRHLFAVAGAPGTDLGQVVQSSDGGRTWRWSGSPAAAWKQLACTADGTVAYAISDRDLFRTPTPVSAATGTRLTSGSLTPAGLRFEWKGEAHRSYRLFHASRIDAGAWRSEGALVADREGRLLLEQEHRDHPQGFWWLTGSE